MAPRKINPDIERRIIEMRESGAGYRLIGEAVGMATHLVGWHCLRLCVDPKRAPRSWDSIRGPAVQVRNGHVLRRFTPEEDEQLLELESQGLSATKIGKKMGRNWSSIIGRLRTLARRDARREAEA